MTQLGSNWRENVAGIPGTPWRWKIWYLLECAKDIEAVMIPISDLVHEDNPFMDTETYDGIVRTMKRIQNANLDYPIIVSECGRILDGRHRVVKAMLNGATHIEVIRFEKNPKPNFIRVEGRDYPYDGPWI